MKNLRMLNGYRVVYLPGHAKAMTSKNWAGYIYEHIVVAEEYLQRSLTDEEVVHHLDGDRANNRRENLLVLERGQHAKLHVWIAAGAPGLKNLGVHGVNSVKAKEAGNCEVCGATLQEKQKRFCSFDCRDTLTREGRPSKEELAYLLTTMSREALGRKYGVTGNAVKKWQQSYGMPTSRLIPSQAGSTLPEGVETSGEVQSS